MTNLFSTAGLELPLIGRDGVARRAAARTPLFALKVVEEERVRVHAAFQPTALQLEAARDYARKARQRFGKAKEEAVRPSFCSEILVTLLGYKTIDPDAEYTLSFEQQIRQGQVDTALGRFRTSGFDPVIIAPFELKGPKTIDLDAPMPGRGRSPVQQAWDYAIDAPGARFVLVSNCIEIRLYGFGRGRDAYEVFDLTRIDEPAEHERLWLILSADRFLNGRPDALLAATDNAYKDVTDRLYADYKALRDRLISFLVDAPTGPQLAVLSAIETSQKLLDRVLFIAFAQGTKLLPERLIERAASARNEFHPEPMWRNFAKLFRAVDKGATDLKIWPYNGGLFAEDPIADSLTLPDYLTTDIAKLGEWDYRREVPVTVLGHIFEQSITDIERRKAEARGEPAPKTAKRKREGVVYTPAMVTRFLVERTIGETLRETFDRLWADYGMGEASTTDAQTAFWGGYLGALRALRILDPACGSGAFLVAAFDALAAEYGRVEAALAALGVALDFDIYDEIVSKNLYGVDLNAESIEITRLSLWLKTARPQHRLQNLEATICVGDSLIDDGAFTSQPFDWPAKFPEVFANGRFDIVIGNPPYVRMELIKEIKPYLAEHYVVASDRADLYAYFFERGVRLLKAGGRLGFISSSSFFRTGSGEPLRTFLTDRLSLETVVDFGDAQIFEGVTTYPAIVTLRNSESDSRLSFLVVRREGLQDIGRAFRESAATMPQSRLGSDSWKFEQDDLARIREKIARGRKTLGDVYGPPLYGIKTGLNEAFIVDTATRNAIVSEDHKSAELLRPFLRGEDVTRWRVEPHSHWLINTPKGKVDINQYPGIKTWLLPFRPALEARATKQEWWELQQAQLAYQPKMAAAEILFPDLSQGPKFAGPSKDCLMDCTIFFIEACDEAVRAVLNSKVSWFFLFSISNPLRGGKWRLRLKSQYLERLPLPEISPQISDRLKALDLEIRSASQRRFALKSDVGRRILDAAPAGSKLTSKLNRWHTLDFRAFLAEMKRALHTDIPLKQRSEWQSYFDENHSEIWQRMREIDAAEREVNEIVFGLFQLAPEEIALIEGVLQGQY